MKMDTTYTHIEIETGYGHRAVSKSGKYNKYHYSALFSALIGVIILVTYLITKPIEIHVCISAVFYNFSILLFLIGVE